MANKKRRAKTKEKARAREALRPLAERFRMELYEFREAVRTTARAQISEAERRARLLQYRDAAEACVRAFAAIDGNEQGALVIGRILGIREWERDTRPYLRLQRKIREWARDNPSAIEAGADEALRAFAADEGNREALRESSRARLEPVKRPWLLAAIDACKGPYASDSEQVADAERRILLELGATPNEIAAFQDSDADKDPDYDRSTLRSYADSATTRTVRRLAARLRQKLSKELVGLKRKRKALLAYDQNPNMSLTRPFRARDINQLDEEIASKEEVLARLNARRRS